MTKIEEAISIISQLGYPKAQQNERSGLCLLGLLNLSPSKEWKDSEAPLMGITPLMAFAKDHYGKDYAPNTRETFRRQTMHQFVDGGLTLYNPDNPKRPVNSPKAVYQIEPEALALIKCYGQDDWKERLTEYLSKRKTLVDQYAKRRQQRKIPVRIEGETNINISPGKHSELIKKIVEEFAPRFAPGSTLIYAGDTGEKVGYFNEEELSGLGVSVNKHGKMPDVVLHFKEKNWLLLVEAVTSHGPVDPKRHNELAVLFKDSKAGLVYVTAFPSKTIMAKYLSEISWETEVWIADNPSHLIHFDGERFLGPYQEKPDEVLEKKKANLKINEFIKDLGTFKGGNVIVYKNKNRFYIKYEGQPGRAGTIPGSLDPNNLTLKQGLSLLNLTDF